MTFTAAEHLDAVQRTLATVTRDEEELRLLTLARTVAASPDEVWDAVVTRERVGRWLGPLSGDLQVGGRFELDGGASGEVLACERAERLSITWEHDGAASRVVVSLRPTGEGTLLQLDHSVDLDDRYRELGPGAPGVGWERALVGLVEHLGAAADVPGPATSTDLGDFVSVSIAAWGEAAIAGGDGARQARAAAQRCASAYVGR